MSDLKSTPTPPLKLEHLRTLSVRGSKPAVAGRGAVALGSMLLDSQFCFALSILLRGACFLYPGLNLSESCLFPSFQGDLP